MRVVSGVRDGAGARVPVRLLRRADVRRAGVYLRVLACVRGALCDSELTDRGLKIVQNEHMDYSIHT